MKRIEPIVVVRLDILEHVVPMTRAHADRRDLCLSTVIVRTARCAYDKGGWQDNAAWWVVGTLNTLEQPLRRRCTHLIWRNRDSSERRMPERSIGNVIKPNYRKVLPRHATMGLQT